MFSWFNFDASFFSPALPDKLQEKERKAKLLKGTLANGLVE
jgi:hypothetical protein